MPTLRSILGTLLCAALLSSACSYPFAAPDEMYVPPPPTGVQPVETDVPSVKARTRTSTPVDPVAVPVTTDAPRLWIEGQADRAWVDDFGIIPADEPTERDYVLVNRGGAVLILEIKSGHAGPFAVIADSVLEPGEQTTLRVLLDPRSRSYGDGRIEHRIPLYSNDPLAPLVEITVRARFDPRDLPSNAAVGRTSSPRSVAAGQLRLKP